MPELPPPCRIQQELIEEARQNLLQLSELTRQQAQALESGNQDMLMKLDHRVEFALGEKERSLGALTQHRKEHGC